MACSILNHSWIDPVGLLLLHFVVAVVLLQFVQWDETKTTMVVGAATEC